MILRLYSWLMRLAQPLLRRKLARRGVAEPGYLLAVEERFGHYGDIAASPVGNALNAPLVWVHAVSLGETRAAGILIAHLRAQQPGLRVLLTHGTATGRAEGATLLQPGDVQVWQPWDTPEAVAMFLSHFQPRFGVLMETEIWPNLVAACQARRVPLVLANARLSEKSLRQAQRLAWLSRPAYRALAAVYAQTEADACRLRSLGAPVAAVLGNLKFDATPNAQQLAQGRAWRAAVPQPVVMLASSRDGEERDFLLGLKHFMPPALIQHGDKAIDSVAIEPTSEPANDLATAPASVQWLIVPRHPQRFDAVAALCTELGFAVSRRSTWRDGPPTLPKAASPGQPVVWLGDTLGDMALYYGLSDLALLGGSFAPLGGQNLIEAAACACPLLMGPHTHNFAEAAEQSLQAGAAWRVASFTEALQQTSRLLAQPEMLDEAAAAALVFAAHHRGAARKTAEALSGFF